MKKKSRNILIVLVVYAIIYILDLIVHTPSIIKSDFGILNSLKLFISLICFIIIPIYYFIEEYKGKSNNFMNNLLILSALMPATFTTISFIKSLSIANLTLISISNFLGNIVYLLYLIKIFRSKNSKYNNVLLIISIALFIFKSSSIIILSIVKTIELYSLYNIVFEILQLIIKIMIILYIKNREPKKQVQYG